ncbi:AAA family ATPase [Nisaea sp.]|uniref:AAA family ATPase n=1 Tax=Nisaea sp. TaxID=2024842 RepID=UPI002B265A47|nr:AAA family ATPase [Nisaea sp.]
MIKYKNNKIIIVVFSGGIASGKTTVSKELVNNFLYKRISTGTYLSKKSADNGRDVDRETLQNIGEELDIESGGSWVVDLAKEEIHQDRDRKVWVFDSIRRDFQLKKFLDEFQSSIFHVHIEAPRGISESRFYIRAPEDGRDVNVNFDVIKSNETEIHAGNLGPSADLVLNTAKFSPSECAKIINDNVEKKMGEGDEANNID